MEKIGVMLRKIEQTREFKKDLKRLARSGRYQLDDLETVLSYLLAGQELPKKYRDHILVGNWIGYKECHIKPDWLLIYKEARDTLFLVRSGSHAQLFG